MKKISKATLRKQLQKKAGNLWKEYCKKRDKTCRMCGSSKVLQVHHIFSRGKKRLFLDVENGITLCSACHLSVTFDDSAKETLRRMIDKDIWNRLYEQSLFRGPFLDWKNIGWLETQIRILNELLEEK